MFVWLVYVYICAGMCGAYVCVCVCVCVRARARARFHMAHERVNGAVLKRRGLKPSDSINSGVLFH